MQGTGKLLYELTVNHETKSGFLLYQHNFGVQTWRKTMPFKKIMATALQKSEYHSEEVIDV